MDCHRSARNRDRRVVCLFFFFSSRRRHTRLQGDWSSDVCSSDLAGGWGMTALTRWLQRRGVGRVLDTRPLKPDQLRREWRQSLHSVLIFGIGMIVPWGLLQLGWARLEPDAGPWQIGRAHV